MVDSLEQQAGKLLRQRQLKLSLAESCTGGLLGDRITNLPGSSDYFWGSIVSYAYEAKAALLHVSWDTLNSHGAVSRETVLEMAHGARALSGTDVAVSVSGIAGPGGGTEEKPVFGPARDLADLSEKARAGKLSAAEMQGGCFTISSLGGIGGTAFTPITNAPEVAILGVSRSAYKPVYKDGVFVPRLMSRSRFRTITASSTVPRPSGSPRSARPR